MNLNQPRIDNGAPLTAAEVNYAAYTSECCVEPETDPRRKARINWWGVATVIGFALSAGLVGFAIVTGWRLARGGF